MKFMASSPVRLMLSVNKTTNELFRAGFVSTAIAEGIFDRLRAGPATAEDI